MKWKTPIRCSECGTTAVRLRDLVYKTGTSTYSGKSSTIGISVGLTKKHRPRVWLGRGSQSGRRHTLRARDARPLSLLPPTIMGIIIIIIFILPTMQNASVGTSGFLIFGLVFSGVWFMVALFDRSRYKKEWMCNKCGALFIPGISEVVEDNHSTTNPPEDESNMETLEKTTDQGGKACSICGT